MASPEFDYVDAIIEHSEGFAAAAARDLDAPVEHCPGWSVADLVAHLTGVHKFWGTVVAEHITEPPSDDREPEPAARDELISTFRIGADRLATILQAANPADHVWTWSPSQQTAGFVVRHQVQEAAVHHWDAAHATGAEMQIAPAVAADSIEEFLTVSVPNPDYPAAPELAPLGGSLDLRCTDLDAGWTISAGPTPRTLTFARNAGTSGPAVSGTAGELLLWLYHRVELDSLDVGPTLIERFRTLCDTD